MIAPTPRHTEVPNPCQAPAPAAKSCLVPLRCGPGEPQMEAHFVCLLQREADPREATVANQGLSHWLTWGGDSATCLPAYSLFGPAGCASSGPVAINSCSLFPFLNGSLYCYSVPSPKDYILGVLWVAHLSFSEVVGSTSSPEGEGYSIDFWSP